MYNSHNRFAHNCILQIFQAKKRNFKQRLFKELIKQVQAVDRIQTFVTKTII